MNTIENLKDLIIYQSKNNDNVSIEVLYDDEDFWLTQKSMSKLFNVEVNTINYHLKEVFKLSEGEANYLITAQKGEGLLKVGNDTAILKITPTKKEFEFVETNLNKLKG